MDNEFFDFVLSAMDAGKAPDFSKLEQCYSPVYPPSPTPSSLFDDFTTPLDTSFDIGFGPPVASSSSIPSHSTLPTTYYVHPLLSTNRPTSIAGSSSIPTPVSNSTLSTAHYVHPLLSTNRPTQIAGSSSIPSPGPNSTLSTAHYVHPLVSKNRPTPTEPSNHSRTRKQELAVGRPAFSEFIFTIDNQIVKPEPRKRKASKKPRPSRAALKLKYMTPQQRYNILKRDIFVEDIIPSQNLVLCAGCTKYIQLDNRQPNSLHLQNWTTHRKRCNGVKDGVDKERRAEITREEVASFRQPCSQCQCKCSLPKETATPVFEQVAMAVD